MIHKLSDADWDLVNDVVLRGAFNGFRAVAPWFRTSGSRRGREHLVGGGHARRHRRRELLRGQGRRDRLTKSMADEWARFGVTVNCIAPGYVETQLSGQMPEALKADIVSRIPVGRAGRPEDVAAAVAYFCSPDAGFVTGQVLEVHGGLSEMTPPTASAPR